MIPQSQRARREQRMADYIPYTAHVSPQVVKTRAGDYVQVLALGGASFESADDEQLNNWHERLNVLWRNVGTPQVSVWTHVIRRRERPMSAAAEGADFSSALARRYAQRVGSETLMVNRLYVSLVYRPTVGVAPGLVSKWLTRGPAAEQSLALKDALEACQKLAQTVQASLARYEPELLTLEARRGRFYSQILEFLTELVSGEAVPMPLPTAPLNEVLAVGRVSFGVESLEYRSAAITRIGAMLGIKEYPTPTTVGMFNRLLSAPFAFVLTQSFTFLSKAAAQGLLQRQYHRLGNAGDFAVSQAQELKEALDALTSNAFVMGDHHLSLQVLADVAYDPASPARSAAQPLNDAVALARSMLADTGMTVAREDLALEAAFWAQLPGQFSMRPRKAAITSRNFSAMAPFHNYPSGRARGNHWGDALTVLITSARSPYHFSLHASDPTDPDGGSRKDTGHTFICGPTGSGKSVLIGFLAAVLQQRGVTQVIFDKDRGLEILVRAVGGIYLPLKSGEPTGFNPLQLAETARNREFLKSWLRLLVRGQTPLAVREERDLDQALRGVLALPHAERRLSRLLEFTDPTQSDGLYGRLSRWCASARGEYAHLFDNPQDDVVDRIQAHPTIGFDVTEFLGDDAARAPLSFYLFHLVRQLLDGRQLVCWMDEFWRLLQDPAFEGFAKDGPKTWRKLNGVMCLATQSASDVLQSGISRTVIEQTPTKIFFPNGDANAAEYMDGFGLSEREFTLIKEELEPGSRAFLVKQGSHSVVCQLDLKGFDAELRVISGRAHEVAWLHELMTHQGSAPEQWLETFMAGRGAQPSSIQPTPTGEQQ